MQKSVKGWFGVVCVVLCVVCLFSFAGCSKDTKEQGYQKNPDLNTSEEVHLTIASSMETWAEMDTVIAKFEELYPNCTISCEYIESYTKNLPVRLQQTEQIIDIFRTQNFLPGNPLIETAVNLISEDSKKILDLSGCHPGLVANYKYIGAENTQYVIPYGGEMRGLYVNVTLLKSLGLEVPKNITELLNCCQVLLDNGYIPFQALIGSFAQQLLYPYICNKIVNGGDYERTYAAIENIEPGISEYFRDAYSILYEIVEKGYYDYKRTEEELSYFGSDMALNFLNIIKVSDDKYEKKDDIGCIPFMTNTQAFALNIEKAKSDYHSEIEYEFITSPVGDDGGYAYLSPSDGLAINKAAKNLDWALEFLNFFFSPEISTEFANQSGKIPNTKDALLKYDIPENRTSDVGQVTFSYSFYKTVTTLMLAGYNDMIGISKMNAKKYMKDNGDGTYSIVFTLDEYMARLEEEFQKIKAGR